MIALLGMGSGTFGSSRGHCLRRRPASRRKPGGPPILTETEKSDLVAAIPGASGYERIVGLLFTGSAWVFQEESLPQIIATSGRVVNVADFNGDGCADLAWKDSVSGLNRRYSWLINHCDGTFERSTGILAVTSGRLIRWIAPAMESISTPYLAGGGSAGQGAPISLRSVMPPRQTRS